MKNITFCAILISLVLIYSCDTNQIECIRASSIIVSENRDLKDFKGVVFSSLGDIYLTQGSEFSFTIVGPENVVELMSAEVENELLVIGTNTCFNGSYDLSIEITAPEYKYINLAGTGRIIVVNQIEGDVLAIERIGVGDIEADVYVDSLYTSISGAGAINYTGEVIRHEITSSGIFTLNSYELQTAHTKINMRGEGDSYVNANESLTVVIAGIGDVYYKGNPTTIDSQILGTGEVINDN